MPKSTAIGIVNAGEGFAMWFYFPRGGINFGEVVISALQRLVADGFRDAASVLTRVIDEIAPRADPAAMSMGCDRPRGYHNTIVIDCARGVVRLRQFCVDWFSDDGRISPFVMQREWPIAAFAT